MHTAGKRRRGVKLDQERRELNLLFIGRKYISNRPETCGTAGAPACLVPPLRVPLWGVSRVVKGNQGIGQPTGPTLTTPVSEVS